MWDLDGKGNSHVNGVFTVVDAYGNHIQALGQRSC